MTLIGTARSALNMAGGCYDMLVSSISAACGILWTVENLLGSYAMAVDSLQDRLISPAIEQLTERLLKTGCCEGCRGASSGCTAHLKTAGVESA